MLREVPKLGILSCQRSVIVICLAFCFTIPSCKGPSSGKAIDGVIEVGKSSMSLDGQWEFYWDQLLAPSDFSKPTSKVPEIISVPMSWDKAGYDLFGKATYRLQINNVSENSPGLLLPKIYSASRVWVNGKELINRGSVKKSSYKNEILEGISRLETRGSYEIIIQVSNYDAWKAGLVEAPVFGEYDHLRNVKETDGGLQIFWSGSLIIMALFYLVLFFSTRRFLPYLLASMFGIFLVLRLLVMGDHFVYYLLSSSTWFSPSTQAHIFHFATLMLTGIGVLYFQSIYPVKKIKALGKYLFYFYIAAGFGFLLFPMTAYAQLSSLLWILVAVGVAFVGLNFVFGLKERKSLLQIVAVSLVLLAGFADLTFFLASGSNHLLPIAASIFLAFQFIYLTRQYGRIFLEAEQMNKKLDETVRDRTRTIVDQNETLEKQAKTLEDLDAAKNKFYENVNHDLRTPLMLIEGYVQRINEDEDNFLTTKSTSDLQKLLRNLTLIRSLNDQMNDLSLVEKKKLKLNFEQVTLAEFIRETVDLFIPKAQMEGKNLKFRGNVDFKTLAHLDKQQFSRVLFNILNNALQYTPEDGTISVILQAHKKNDGFTICIYNTGKAIAHEVLPHLFDRFYRGQNEGKRSNVKGMGIGLELAKEITTLHNGTIMADSLTNEGTCFFISLPFNLEQEISQDGVKIEGNLYAESNPAPVAKKDTNTIKVDAKKANILLVDDNQEIRDYIKDILGPEYSIDEAENGKVALGKIDTGFYDLVISDIMMPWMDGFELMKRMNEEKYREIPIMIVSARTSEKDKLKILDDGALDVLTKPFNPKELSQRVANILKYKNTWNAYDDLNHKHKNKIEKDLVSKLQALILEHIDDTKLSVAMIADELCMAERSAYRLIKTVTGKTPLDYIKSLRYEYAYDLITKGKVSSVSEAARLIGITNTTYFSGQFKKRYNVAPDALLK